MAKPTQTDRVLERLKKAPLTQLEALTELGVMRLGARILELREAGHDPMAIRLALLAHHYRTDWEYTDADLAAAEERLARWRGVLNEPSSLPAAETIAAVRDALRDDLDAPAALAAVDTWVEASETIGGDDTDAVCAVVAALDALLGVRL